ncbi:TIGR03808 family TAT-translocated repetitive protein [Pararhizobium sp.]|uniref:TIGR03808 family TAT-translocated repetitive protein n=1 Tax=Pararhizobium sp. TaxID=1977563 RepID=UPI00271ABC71|nr:TIGR03808 family TAT-translocated repetitive protein [Pararhizobium sp.]MDO9417217.1 TIGR03808 family TAT-translocated repetitive protein [Pararhizobium sp.]
MVSRRLFLSSVGFAALGAALPARAGGLVVNTTMRGSLDAVEQGLRPDATDDQSKAFNRIIAKAAMGNVPVFLPPGNYVVSNITLPENAHITGVPGASRLVYTGQGHLFFGENMRSLTLSNITIDGGNRWLADYAGGLVHLRNIAQVVLENCEIAGASKHAVHLEYCGGRIDRNRISGAALAGIYAVESKELSIADNSVSDCANGGILVHRWQKAADGTMISGNRISKIASKAGGTGENGNGIGLFRADNVMITGNAVSDCALSAIRANAASNVQIANNHCLRSGETAIFSEFGFEGALVTGNLIDGAANGILIVNFDSGGRLATVSSNIVRNMRLDGPYPAEGAGFGLGIAAEADVVISGNTIENAPKWGMMLGWGPYMRNIVATGNLVRQSPVGCAVTVVEGSGAALIADNLFQDVRDGAVVGYRWTEKSTGDLALDGADEVANLTVSRNRVG